MNRSRRGLAALLGAIATGRSAWAQDARSYPSEPVRLIVPFPPGGPTDLVARALARDLSADWKQTVVVDNRPGGNSFPAAELVAHAKPDGLTLFLPFFGTLVVNPSLYASLPYDPVRDFAPITTIATLPLMLVVSPSSPIHTIAELIAEAKRRPGSLTYASGGIGQGGHLAGALLERMAGISLVHVPYRGNAPAVADVIAGHAGMIFDGMATSLPHVREGRLRAIAISTAHRASAVPDLPTVAESGLPGFDVGSWFGLMAPARTPAAVVERINAAVHQVMRSDAVRKLLADSGLEPMPGSPADFAGLITTETRRWSTLVRDAGIRIE
jgi:tripartite-type tricarboxylate transporter receptor subunit TctC